MQFLQDDPIHPGSILSEEFLADYRLTAVKVAADLGVNVGRVTEILSGQAPITADFALRLSRYFSNSPEYWLNLQRSYDLALAVHSTEGLDAIKPVHAA